MDAGGIVLVTRTANGNLQGSQLVRSQDILIILKLETIRDGGEPVS